MQELTPSRGALCGAAYGAFGVLLWLLAAAATLLPPIICVQLVWRGLTQRHPSWVIVGGVAGALSALLVTSLVRRLLARRSGRTP
jgi:hypothetical protein